MANKERLFEIFKHSLTLIHAGEPSRLQSQLPISWLPGTVSQPEEGKKLSHTAHVVMMMGFSFAPFQPKSKPY